MLQYYGILGMPHSWGVVAQFLLVELMRKGVQIKCISTNNLKGIHTELVPAVIKKKQEALDLETNVSLSYTLPENLKKIKSKHKILLFNYETTIMPDGFADLMNQNADLILPSSNFSYNIFKENGVAEKKMRVLHHGFDRALFNPGFKPLIVNNIDPEKFKFLMVGLPHARKGHDILLKAYIEEFRHDEDVVLIIKTTMYSNEKKTHVHVDFNKLFEDLNRKYNYKWPEIKIIDRKLDYLAELYTYADAMVLPTRSEGFSLTPLEAIACKLPVITTRYGGHLDFLNEENSYLIDYEIRKAPKEVQYHTYKPDALMAEPDIEHLKKLMRQVKNNYKEAKEKAETAFQQCSEKFTWENAALNILDMIKERGWEI